MESKKQLTVILSASRCGQFRTYGPTWLYEAMDEAAFKFIRDAFAGYRVGEIPGLWREMGSNDEPGALRLPDDFGAFGVTYADRNRVELCSGWVGLL